jgi:hypothetical protein
MGLKSERFWVHKNFTTDDYTVYRDDGKEITVSVENNKISLKHQAFLRDDEKAWFKKNIKAL